MTDRRIPPDTVTARFEAAVDRHAARPALVDGPSGVTVTYTELDRRVRRLAGWLHGEGVGRGDGVAIALPNVPPVAAITLAAFRLGAWVTAVNPASTHAEIAAQLADARPSIAVATPELVRPLRDAGYDRILVLGEADGATALARALETEPVDVAATRPDDLAMLPFSSGTTGRPKPVMLTQANLVATSDLVIEAIGVDECDVTVAVAPFFHILGATAGLLVPLLAGATIVTVPRFDPAAFPGLIEAHRATYVAIPPPIASVLVDAAADGADLSSLRLVAVGGAPLHVEVQAALADRLPGADVGQGWGLTETTGALCVPRRGEGSAPGTVGRPLSGTEIEVRDPDTGVVLAAGTDGELWARGPQIMAGYRGRPEDTATTITPDGWLRTGDLGHVDEAGNVVIVDRLKELIKVNAFQVAPAEVESALRDHPAVVDAGVVGRPDPRTGEAVVAYVVLAPGADDADLDGWLASRLAHYKRPQEIHRVARLPRTPSGKLLRRRLPDLAAQPAGL